MAGPVTGGCLCGAVRYVYEGELGAAGYCHCADCRRISGSAFGVSVSALASGLRIVSGAPRSYTSTADSGRTVTRLFCADCGSPLFTRPPLHPDRVFIKAGSLDDATLVRPVRQAWTARRVAWARIPDDIESYERGRV